MIKLFKNKKAVSPVIATILLISLTVTSAAVVYFVVIPLLNQEPEITFEINDVSDYMDYDRNGKIDAFSINVIVAFTDGLGSANMSQFQYELLGGSDPIQWKYTELGGTIINEGNDGIIIIAAESASDEISEGETYTLKASYGSSQATYTFTAEAFDEGPNVTINVVDTENDEIIGASVDFYYASGAFTGLTTETTNSQGKVQRPLRIGEYKVRVRYLEQYYWSETFYHPKLSEITVVVGAAAPIMKVRVQNEAGGIEGLTVYSFNPLGQYQGDHAVTNEEGDAYLTVDPGTYVFKVFYLNNNYSSPQVDFPEQNETVIDIGGGIVYAHVVDSDEVGQANYRVYLYSSSGHYLGASRRTNGTGYAAFSLTEGSYKFRVDYGGARSWSETFGAADGAIIPIYIGGKVYAHVIYGPNDQPLSNVRIYMYTASGHYTGRSGRTNATGYLLFNPVAKETYFKFRVNYAGSYFWSSEFTGENAVTIVDINIGAEAYAHVIYGSEGAPLSNVRVYLYTASGHYSGLSTRTNATGYARFNGVLATTQYKFRVNYAGSYYWSQEFNGSEPLTVVDVNIGGTVYGHVTYGPDNDPIANARVYLYTATGHYSGLSTRTNATGYARFNGVLATTNYKFRVNYAGSYYWSETFNGSQPEYVQEINIGGIVYAHVISGPDEIPLDNVRVYLYTASGHYSGLSTRTNSTGHAQFNGVLATTQYKFRVNYAGGYYWSGEFNGSLPLLVKDVNIGGTVYCKVVDGGTPQNNIMVDLFTTGGHYSGLSTRTNASGYAEFIGVLSTETYKFRVNYGGDYYWSEEFSGDQTQDQVIEVDVTPPPSAPVSMSLMKMKPVYFTQNKQIKLIANLH